MSEPSSSPRLASVVPFLYGVADRSWLPGEVLVQLLVDIGAAEDEAHRALAKLRTDGALTSERRGRESDFQLAGLVRLAAKRGRAATNPARTSPARTSPARTKEAGFKDKKQPTWEGTFSGLLYAVPRSERAARNRLRRAARLAGYGALRPGLMIGFRNAWTGLADVVADLPEGASAAPVTLGMKTEDARRAAAEAWRLDRAADKIAAIAERLERHAGESVPQTGAEALRTYVMLALPAYRVVVKIPPLPTELQPDGWPMVRMSTALAEIRSTAGAAAQSYVDELLSGETDSADAPPVGE